MVFIEVSHTTFTPDTGFGIIRRMEEKSTTEIIPEVTRMINNLTSTCTKNIEVRIESRHLKT